MGPEDKKIGEEKESETTDETLSKTGTPAPEPAKSPAQKTKSRSNRYIYKLCYITVIKLKRPVRHWCIQGLTLMTSINNRAVII